MSTRILIKGPGEQTIVRLMRITGLGEGVDRSGSLQPRAVERVLAVLREYRGIMDHYGVRAARMVGTSALRDASNRASFSQAAEAIVGTGLELLSGDDEARLSFRGATAGLGPGTAPWLVADIGGGSTELVIGPEPVFARSLDIGCVRVTERFFDHDPPAPGELSAAKAWLEAHYRRVEVEVPDLRSGHTFVGLAGTVAALACLDQGLAVYDSDAVHHYRLSSLAVERALDLLAAEPAERRSGRPGIETARALFIVGGTLVLATLMAHFGFQQCLVSESDILDGLISTLEVAPSL